MTHSEKIHKQLSEEFKLPRQQVEEACLSMFGLVTELMERGDMQPIRLPYLGIWKCKPERIAKLKEKGLL